MKEKKTNLTLDEIAEVLNEFEIEFDELGRCPQCGETNGWFVGNSLITSDGQYVNLFWCMDCEKLMWMYSEDYKE